jgi:phage-related minor tail protein
MPCDTKLKQQQTLQQRAEEVRKAVTRISNLLASGRVQAKVGPQGAITFVGLTDEERDGVTDACAYRRLMVSGSTLAKAAIARAEQIAGRSVDRQALAHGHHSHNGGKTWHHGH